MTAIHKGKRLTGFIVGVVLLAGCGGAAKVPKEIQQTSLVIDAEGSVTSHMVDVFDKSHYNLEELREMAAAEVAAYNTANQVGTVSPVTMEDAKSVSDSKVQVTYRFDSAETYGKYNGTTFYFGTVAGAENAGYDFGDMNQVLFSADGDESIVSSQVGDGNMAEKHMVILAESTLVYCPYKVSYASESAVIKEDGSVDTTAVLPEEYPVIILLDK